MQFIQLLLVIRFVRFCMGWNRLPSQLDDIRWWIGEKEDWILVIPTSRRLPMQQIPCLHISECHIYRKWTTSQMYVWLYLERAMAVALQVLLTVLDGSHCWQMTCLWSVADHCRLATDHCEITDSSGIDCQRIVTEIVTEKVTQDGKAFTSKRQMWKRWHQDTILL